MLYKQDFLTRNQMNFDRSDELIALLINVESWNEGVKAISVDTGKKAMYRDEPPEKQGVCREKLGWISAWFQGFSSYDSCELCQLYCQVPS
jgi:hypothetical protein